MLAALNLKLAVTAGVVAVPLGVAAIGAAPKLPAGPDVVRVPALTFDYRMAGDFHRNGETVDAPLRRTSLPSFSIMQHEVSSAEYDSCVADGACRPRVRGERRDTRLPAVMLSYEDARAYADWLTRRTGDLWRLPSDAEWAAAAGSRFHGNTALISSADPSVRWLATYEEESNAAKLDEKPRPFGSFGTNEHGLSDVSGNVWEWTDTCFTRYTIDGAVARATMANCGVRVVEGAHRTYITNFIRDARGGGCAVGTPPSNLGVRLVRKRRVTTRLIAAIGRMIAQR